MNTPKPKLAVVSPFVDKGHGTERIIAEWLARLADSFEIHLYSQRVADLDLSRVFWHRVPKIPGPHVLNYPWWFAANHFLRFWDHRVRGLRHDLVFSPGVNCLDADVISVHIVFAAFRSRVRPAWKLTRNPLRFWLRLLHRRIYYNLILFLEGRVYRNAKNFLVLIARKSAADLARHYGRHEGWRVVYLGLDHETYSPARRLALRREARTQLGLDEECFTVLLVGNDWHNKGVRVLLSALSQLPDLPVVLLVVGRDDPAPFARMAREAGVHERVQFLPPRNDVEFYYAAADVLAGPSLEDTFSLPPAEAMACGLPVVVSRENGASEILTRGFDGLILDDPHDAPGLAAMIRQLCENPDLRCRMGERAADRARQFTWERSASEIKDIFVQVLERKNAAEAAALRQEA